MRATDFFNASADPDAVDREQLARAEDYLRQAIALKPGDFRSRLTLAEVLLARGDLEHGFQEAQAAVQAGAEPTALFRAYVLRSRAAFAMGQYEDALDAADAARILRPDAPAPHILRAAVCLQKGHYEDAVQSYTRHLELGGNEKLTVYLGRAQAYTRLGSYPQAIADYSRALELKRDAGTFLRRGWIYVLVDSWPLALDDFQKAIELNPADSSAHIGRGLARVMLGRLDAGIADAEQALRRPIEAPEMMYNLACLFAQASVAGGEGPKAATRESLREKGVAALRKALDMLPTDGRGAFWRDKISRDRLLDPLRKLDSYKVLQKEYTRGRGAVPRAA